MPLRPPPSAFVPLRALRASVVKPAAVAALLLAALLAAWPGRAAAHPLGNFTVNRYTRVEPDAGRIRVAYALDMAEIPSFQELPAIDRDRDGTVSDAERDEYLARKLPELARGLRLTVNGDALGLLPESGALTLAEGQGGLRVLRIDARFAAELPAAARGHIVDAWLRDTNYDNRLGWKEIVVRGTAGAAVRESSVPAADASDALHSYPEDALQSPPEVREARFRFEPGVADPGAGGTTSSAARAAERTSRAAGGGGLSRFAEAAAARELTLPVVLFSLAAAVFWGALHALGPGHGKTVVAAYLVGARGTARHALLLGLTVTATHTAGVYLLGAVTLTASHFIVPERLYPILSLASGLLVLGMGASLLVGRLRGVRIARGTPAAHHAPVTAAEREPVLAGAGASGGTAADWGHDAAHADNEGQVRTTNAHNGHDHRADHDHGHGHGHGPTHHDHGHGHGHTHPGAAGRPVTWRGLLALGVYGGLIPCPTAIVVLLTSISLNRLGYGLLLVVAFSAGLAVVLTGIGMALVYAGRALPRVRAPGGLLRAVPVASAAAVVVAGLLITLRALGQTGL